MIDPETIVFDPEQTKSIMVIGEKNSGKSTLLKFLTKKLVRDLNIYRVYIFSGTAELNPIYMNWTPYVYGLDFDRIDRLLERQRIMAVNRLVNPKIELKKILIILDDYTNSINMHSKECINTFGMLAVQGRHIGIITAYISHRYSSNQNTIRCAQDMFFVTKTDIDSIQDKTTGLYSKQVDYESPKLLWKDYKENTKQRYSFMCIQKIDPYAQTVLWYNPIDTKANNSFKLAADNPELAEEDLPVRTLPANEELSTADELSGEEEEEESDTAEE